MSTQGFGTETETMAATATKVHDVNEQVGAQLRTLQSQLAPLEGAWRGQASVAFQTLMVRFNENAEKLRQALQGIGDQISGSSTTYATEDDNQSSAMSQISSALG